MRLLSGDCIERLRQMEPESVDAIVCDPPYSYEFMGHEWDTHESPAAFQEWCKQWAIEALRVLKPGGHLVAFGGTKTAHRLTSGIEDAGFEIRDGLAWVYGQGFPKGQDIGKTLAEWNGWNTALKPAFEPIVLARKPLGEKTVAANVLKHGTGAINIDACRIQAVPGDETSTHSRSEEASGAATIIKLAAQETHQTDGQRLGRWPSNVILGHAESCQPVGTRKIKANGSIGADTTAAAADRPGKGALGDMGPRGAWQPYGDGDGTETVEAWDCIEDCPARLLDEQGGSARFFLQIEGTCQYQPANPVAARSSTTQANKESTAPLHATQQQKSSPGLPASRAVNPSNSDVTSTVLSDAAMDHEPTHSAGFQERFMNEMETDSNKNGEIGTPPIKSIAQKFLRAPEGGQQTPPGNLVLSVVPNQLTDTTTTTANPTKSDIYAAPATSNTTEMNMEAGALGSPRFKYQAKANNGERWGFCKTCGSAFNRKADGAKHKDHDIIWHATVKPVNLMRWLVRLVTPPGGVVLDPFLGTGTTGVAALEEGFRFIGIEKDATYFQIAAARIKEHARNSRTVDHGQGPVGRGRVQPHLHKGRHDVLPPEDAASNAGPPHLPQPPSE